jgi:D-amino-acid oxidase
MLCHDRALSGVRGQVVRIVDRRLRTVLLGADQGERLTYIIPRVHDIVLGGTFEAHQSQVAIDAEVRAEILMRCADLALQHGAQRFAMSLAARVGGDFAAAFAARVLPRYRAAAPATLSLTPDGCGLRPLRHAVRLEAESLAPDRVLLHNYGHGGAGVTLSWGCADEVVARVAAVA